MSESRALEGKAAVVTGGTSGIGRATAALLLAHGARVLLIARSGEEVARTVSELAGRDGRVEGVTGDVSEISDVRRLFETVDERFGRLDVLVNNAAVSPGGFADETLEELRYTVDTNLFGYVACAREAVRRMRDSGSGHIVNIGSMSADLREEENSVYVASKAAIQAFSQSLRKTVNPAGIRVTLVEPGRVATDMVEASAQEKRRQQAELEMLAPEDVARCVLFCLVQPARCEVVSVQLRPHLQII